MTEFLATIIPLALLAVFAIVRRHKREMRKIAANNLYAARRTEKTYREGPTYFSDRWTGGPIS